MLIRHVGIYAIGRGLPGVINLVALSLYTRLLSPQDYGRYTLLLACVGVLNAVGFYWLRVSAVRQLPVEQDRRPMFLGALYSTYVWMALGSVAVAVLAFVVTGGEGLKGLILAGMLLLLSQTWFELQLDLLLASLQPIRYAVLAAVRALIAALVGAVLAYLGYGPLGVALGAAFGYLASALATPTWGWRPSLVMRPDWVIVAKILAFGLPMAGVYALGVVTGWSDRILLAWLAGTPAAGQYAAASDATLQTITALMMVVNLSAVPLAVRAYETAGPAAAAARLAEHGVILVGLALPASVGLAFLAPQIAHVVLGPSFQASARELIPLIAIGSLLAGMKAFYFDLAFQLGNATRQQLRISALASAMNIVLNLWLIPRFGARGAAYAMVATFATACTFSAVLGKRAFHLPVPLAEWAKIAMATLAMVLALWIFRGPPGGVLALLLSILGGASVYFLAAAVLNVGGTRRYLAVLPRLGTRT